LSLLPGLPTLELPPDLVLMIFPPLLYSAAFFSSPRDLRANFRPIAFVSVGLVLLTAVTVAVVGHAVIGLPWPVAFVLGGISRRPIPRHGRCRTRWSLRCPEFPRRSQAVKTSLVGVSGPRFGCRGHVFGPFEPGSVPPIGPRGSFSTGSSPLSRRFALLVTNDQAVRQKRTRQYRSKDAAS
jgi:hypothetical protein